MAADQRIKTGPAARGSGVKFNVSDEAYAKSVTARKACLRDAARRIERGESLDGMPAPYLAWELRRAADQIPEAQPRQPGQAPQVDHGAIAMGYAIMVGPGGIGKTKAIDRLAEQFDCSVTTVKTAIRKYGAEAVGIVGGPTGKLKQE